MSLLFLYNSGTPIINETTSLIGVSAIGIPQANITNLLTNSSVDSTGSYWTLAANAINLGYTTDPWGGNTATIYGNNGSSNATAVISPAITTIAGNTYTVSIWAKLIAGIPINTDLFLINNVNSEQSSLLTNYPISDIWQRFSYSFTALNAADIGTISAKFLQFLDSGVQVALAGAQVEIGGSMSTFVPTTSGAVTITNSSIISSTVAVPLTGVQSNTSPGGITNALIGSGGFVSGFWIGTRLAAITTGKADPFGGTGAALIVPNAGAPNTHYINNTHVTITSGVMTLSVYLQPNSTGNYYSIGLTDNTAYSCSISVDIANGTIVNNSGSNTGFTYIGSTITYEGNGWYRASITVDNMGINPVTAVQLQNMDNSESLSFQGSPAYGVNVYGVQVEPGYNVSDFVATTTVTGAITVIGSDVASPLTSVSSTSGVGSVNVPIIKTISLSSITSTSGVGSIEPSIKINELGTSSTSGVGVINNKDQHTLSGVTSTSGIGSDIVKINKSLVGISTTSSVGTIVSTDKHALVGIGITSSINSVTDKVSISLTGIQSTSGIGSVIKKDSHALTSVSSSSSIGNITTKVSKSLIGVNTTSATANVIASSSKSVSLTGVSSTSNKGTVTTRSSDSRNLTGVSIASNIATLRLYLDSILAGINSASGKGNVAPLFGIDLVGTQSTTNIGTVKPSISKSHTLTSVASTTLVGTVSDRATASHTLTGVQSTSQYGTVIDKINASPNLIGVSSASNYGSVKTFHEVKLTGISSTGGYGILSHLIDSNLIGVQSTSAHGNVTINVSKSVHLTGVQSTSNINSVSDKINASPHLVGMQVVSGIGILSHSTTKPLIGKQSVSSIGTLLPTLSISLSGTDSITTFGTVSINSSASHTLIGVQGVSEFGNVTITASDSVNLIGITSPSHVGILALKDTISLNGIITNTNVELLLPIIDIILDGVTSTTNVGTLIENHAINLTGVYSSTNHGIVLPKIAINNLSGTNASFNIYNSTIIKTNLTDFVLWNVSVANLATTDVSPPGLISSQGRSAVIAKKFVNSNMSLSNTYVISAIDSPTVLSIYLNSGTLGNTNINVTGTIFNSPGNDDLGDSNINVDLTGNGIINSTSSENNGILYVGDGWYRAWITFPAELNTQQISLSVTSLDTTSPIDSYLELYGFQAETGTYPSAYGTGVFLFQADISTRTSLSSVSTISSIGSVLPSVIVNDTGVITTGDIATLSIDNLIPITGIQSISEIGSVSYSIETNLNGVYTYSLVGYLDIQGAEMIPLNGIDSITNYGNVSVQIDESIALVGISNNTEVGNVSVSTGISTALISVGSNTAVEDINKSIDIGLLGISIISYFDQLIIDNSSILSGVQSITDTGSIIAESDSLLTGIASVSSYGLPGDLFSYRLTGVISDSEVGSLIPSLTSNLIGVNISSNIGSFNITTSESIQLVGVLSNTNAGVVITTSAHLAPLSGLQIVSELGTIIPSINQSLLGTYANGYAGVLAFNISWGNMFLMF